MMSMNSQLVDYEFGKRFMRAKIVAVGLECIENHVRLRAVVISEV